MQVNKYVRNVGRTHTATEALAAFRAFPQWMWRNADVLDFVGWLQRHNATRAPDAQAGFYGMDLYSLYPSIKAVLSFLKRAGQPELYRRAELRYSGFMRYSEDDPHIYGANATFLGSCERQALAQLEEMIQMSAAMRRAQRRDDIGAHPPSPPDGVPDLTQDDDDTGAVDDDAVASPDTAAAGAGITSRDMLPGSDTAVATGPPRQPPTGARKRARQAITAVDGKGRVAAVDTWALEPDDGFVAEQNARVVTNAEAYYRAVFGRQDTSWNVRDHHMTETLGALLDHLAVLNHLPEGTPSRVVVWAHNSHLGDARATSMADEGEVNVGQLCRERWGDEQVAILGFSTCMGTVTAAPKWDYPAQVAHLRPSHPGSWDDAFHAVGLPKFFLDLRNASPVLRRALDEQRLQRAVGVVYRPQTELGSHYFYARPARQFDGLFYFDDTRAVEALEPAAEVDTTEEDLLAGL